MDDFVERFGRNLSLLCEKLWKIIISLLLINSREIMIDRIRK